MSREIKECTRCNCAGQMVNSLQFITDERDVTIYLCDVCLPASRLVWKKFMDDGALPALKDDTIIDFGMYKGRQMSQVPAKYLIFCGDADWIVNKPRLQRYIEKNRDALEEEIAGDN